MGRSCLVCGKNFIPRSADSKFCSRVCMGIRYSAHVYTLETCKADALRFPFQFLWRKESLLFYQRSKQKGWLPECTAHMSPKLPKNTLAVCKAEAAKYSRKVDWQRKGSSTYASAKKRGWDREICRELGLTSQIRHTLEHCKLSARKFTTKSAWMRDAEGSKCYMSAYRHPHWFEECTQHMTREYATDIKFCVYALFFSPYYCYVGVTRNFKVRLKNHFGLVGSTLYGRKKDLTGATLLETDLDAEQASRRERYWLSAYANLYPMLNKDSGGGSTGPGVKRYTLGVLKSIASGYSTKTEWRAGHKKSYDAAKSHGWVAECSKHMSPSVFKQGMTS